MNKIKDDLISEVQERPMLWNKWDEKYKNRILVDKEWSTVADILKKDKEEVKAKWRNLRDQFQRELKKVKPSRSGDGGNATILSRYRGKWAQFESLLFLMDTITLRITHNNIKSDEHNDITEETEPFEQCFIDQHPQQTVTKQELPQDLMSRHKINHLTNYRRFKRKAPKMAHYQLRMRELNKIKLAARENNVNNDADDDLHFVKSLVPYLKKLNPIRKLYIRNEIQSLLLRELTKESPGSSSND